MIARIAERPALSIAFLIAISGYLFFLQLGNLALTDPDETFYAQTTKEMIQRNDWITPHLYGKPQFEKPILFYWLAMCSSKIFGVNEFSVRFPSALFGTLGLIAIYSLGALMFNKRVGLLAGVILGTNVEYIILSRACVTDMVLGVCIFLGILAFFYARIRDKRIYIVVAFAAWALATLTKGPVGIMLPAAATGLYIIAARDWWIFKKPSYLFAAASVFCAIALPWYLIMYQLHGKAFIDAFFGFHNVNRFLEAEHKIGSQWYYYLPVTFGGLFPWSAFLPYALWRSLKYEIRNTKYEIRNNLFLLIWAAVIIGFFSLSSTKLPTYIFPAWIALALMIALAWDELLSIMAVKSAVKAMTISYCALLIVVVAGAIGLFIFLRYDYPLVLKEAIMAGIVLIGGFAASCGTFLRRRYLATFCIIAASTAAILYPLDSLVLPKIEPYETAKEISGALRQFMKPGEALGAESHYVAGLTFYSGALAKNLDKHHDLVQFLSSDKRVWCILKEKNHRQLYELDTKPWHTKPSYVVYQLGKKCIITNLVPEDGKYLLKRERQI